MAAFARPIAISSSNFLQSNMSSNNRSQAPSIYASQQSMDQMGTGSSHNLNMFVNNHREPDMMHSGDQNKTMDTVHISNVSIKYSQSLFY